MQVSQQLFMQRRQRGEMPGTRPPMLRPRQGELRSRKSLQDARTRGARCRVRGGPFIQAGQRRLGLRQPASHLHLQQGQQPQCERQQARQALDVVVPSDT
jgi:hypothetical protein